MCESSAFVIIKGRGFLLEILMKDKQIKIEKTIFYMLLILVMVYRGAILFKYSFYYVDDEGQKVLVNNLATENKYYFMRDQLQVLDGEAMHHTQRIFEKGEYRLTYAFGTKVSFTGDPVDAICKFWINIILK